MLRQWLILTVLTAMALVGLRAADAERVLSLNGSWQFALAQTEPEAEALAKFFAPEFDAKNFAAIPVPSNWALLGFEEPVYRGFPDDKASEGFYLRDFAVPADWRKSRVLLHFGGVWSSAEVWLNGKRLGLHESGYTSFAFDVSHELKAGESNRLAVRVRQVSRDYKSDVFDDWTLGGIFRDVTLEAMPRKRWLDRVLVRTEFDGEFRDADLKLRVMVADRHEGTRPGNYPSPGEPYTLRLTLADADGTEVAKREMTIPAHTSTNRDVPVTLRISAPKHWTAETPHLYSLRVELVEKGKVAHTRIERVGFRQISTAGGVFRINGQPVKLRGVNRHDEHPDVGRATMREHWVQDLTLMKAANINYVRLAHYTPARGFIELCDEMGMYVGNEVSLGGAGGLMIDPSFNGGVLQRAYETVTRDINSPSIVYWSIGNEDPLTALHLAAIQAVKGFDPTRPVLIPWRHEEWLPPEIDLVAPHYWKPGEYDEIAGNATRPVITTEYTHAYGIHGLGGLEARWKALIRHPAGAGGAVWLWADQGLKMPTAKAGGLGNDPHLRLTTDGWDGIVDSYRNPTRDYWEVKAVYAQVYPAVEKVDFVPGQASVRVPIQNDFDFTALENVQITWSIFADDRELAQGTGTISGQPHAASPFELPVAALKDASGNQSYYARFVFADRHGREIARKSVELVPPPSLAHAKQTTHKLVVSKTGPLTIQAGDASFVFDPKSGHLTSALLGGKALIVGLRPTLWRTADANEQMVIGKTNLRDAVDLNRYEATATAWEIREGCEQVAIHAKVVYRVDEKNRFTVDYDYSISRDGRLDVRYAILTDVVVPCVPIVGMSLESAPDLQSLRWFGLGPFDAYPNKRAAPILGVWNWEAGGQDVTGAGTKAMRWFERAGPSGGIRVESEGYFEVDRSKPSSVRILSGVLSRPEKGRKADETFPQLETNTGKPLVGSFSISLP